MKNSERPAFPINEETTDRIDAGITIYTGLTKLEHFTAMAMQGLLASDINSTMTNEAVAFAAREIAVTTLKTLEK